MQTEPQQSKMDGSETEALWAELQGELGQKWVGDPLADLGWSFGLDRAKRRFGQTRFRDKVVTVSEVLLENGIPSEIIEDTLRHEIAHVLDYETRGTSDHSNVWKKWARRCGADPTRTGDVDDKYKADFRWWLFCPKCEEDLKGYYRKPKLNKAHSDCGARLKIRKGPAHPES